MEWIIAQTVAVMTKTAFSTKIAAAIERTCAVKPCNSVLFTPPRNRGGVIFSLQFVCVSVCLCVHVCVCPALLLNKIPAERMHRFRRGFHQTVASRTGSDPIEFGELRSKVKVTVT